LKKNSPPKNELKHVYSRWKKEKFDKAMSSLPFEQDKFTTISGKKIKELYTPADLDGFDYSKELGFPGEYPFTRGIHPSMYRGRLWTMRQFSGFGTAEDTNSRYKYLLAHGQTGLSVAFHLPTLMGIDSDHPLAEGEIGKCGVAIDSLADMEILFDGIPLDKISTSMTINPPAAVLWAMYIAVAEKQGVSPKIISGTIQNDILKEYIAQKTFVFPPEPSMKLIVDTFEYGSKEVPRWNTISISGYHIREAGSTAVQELAFTLRDGIEYVEWAVRRGLDIDEFVPRLSFFFNAHNDFIADSAYWYQKAVEKKEKLIVGVNAFEMEHSPIPTLEIEEQVARQQLERLKEVKRTRNNSEVKAGLLDLKKAAQDDQNLMPFILNCVRVYATLGEIMNSLKEVYGEYKEPITY